MLIPAVERHTEIVVVNSLFIASIAPAFSVEEARAFVAKVRENHPDASHHVPAFIIGHGAGTTDHCSDDGEPQGTAGRPALAVLKGSGLGDVVVVVTRYFGGSKLGTGGLVRAYTDSVKAVLAGLPLAEKTSALTVRLVTPYALFERVKILCKKYKGRILDSEFAGDITLSIQLIAENFQEFNDEMREISSGTIQTEVIETNPAAIFPLES
jgi:uncharacterized YigZ family protein